MILIDTSAWVEFLRDTGSPTCRAVDDLLDGDIAVCDPVCMEVLAGARDDLHLNDLRGLLARAGIVNTTPADYETAASLYRACRRQGETVRRLTDCLIASAAIAARTPVLHADADFDVLARHTLLEVVTL
ncbi:MAG: PIN domain nuclease [Actinobacteria bacterium]|nr:PIN domain nuclease [Actinomycetota bacterium]